MDKLFNLIQTSNNNNAIKQYISSHPKLNLNTEIHNNRIIEYVIAKNNIDLLNFLIKQNIELNYITTSTEHLITYDSIKYNYNEITKILINHIDLNLADKFNLYTIHYAIMFHNDEIFDILIKKQTNLTKIYDEYNNNLLFFSIIYNYLYGINKLLDIIDIYENNINNENLLMFITRNNNNYIYNDLILKLIDISKYKFDINQQDNIYNETFIFYLCYTNNIKILKSKQFKNIINLINLSAQNNNGDTIFHYVLEHKSSLDFIYYLIDNYPTLCYVNKYNRTYKIPLYELINKKISLNFDNDYTKYFDFLIKNSNLNFKANLARSSLDLLLIFSLWKQYKKILKHKKLIIDKNIFYKYLSKDDQNELIELLIDNHIYFLKKYNKLNKSIKNYFISYKECNNNIEKCKLSFKEKFKQNENILFKPIKYKTYKFINLYNYRHELEFIGGNDYYLTLICYMKYLESYDINCLYDNKNYSNNIYNDKYIIIYFQNNLDNINEDIIIDKLFKSNKQYSIINLQIFIVNTFHSNFLFYNKNNNTIMRIDPLNYFNNKIYNKNIDNYLYNIFKKHNISYILPKETLKSQYMGIQITADFYIMQNEFCLFYCVLFVLFKINNLDLSYNKLIKTITTYDNEYPNFKYRLNHYILTVTRDYVFNKLNYDITKYYSDELTNEEYINIYKELFSLTIKNDLKLIEY